MGMAISHTALVSLSGGMDSATVLARAIHSEENVLCVGFTYGSKHNSWENTSARRLANHYSVPFRLIDLTKAFGLFRSNLLSNGGDIPEGHYEASSMQLTVVPGRNLIFASILAGLAQSLDIEAIWLGVHAGDHAIYPDCRPDFIDALKRVIHFSSGDTVSVVTPYLKKTKGDIVKEGLDMDVPYHLTRTCYKSQQTACGKCGSCTERLEAFKINGVKDPIPYEG